MEEGCFLETWVRPNLPGDSSLKKTNTIGASRGLAPSVTTRSRAPTQRLAESILSDRLDKHFVRQSAGVGKEGEPGAQSEQFAAVAQEKRVGGGAATPRGSSFTPTDAPSLPPDSKAIRNEVPEGSVGPHFPEYKKDLGLLKVVPNLTSYPELHPGNAGSFRDPCVWATHRRGCMVPDSRALLLSVGFTCDCFLC